MLGSRSSADGTKGLFFPDNFTFGQTVYLSPIYAAVAQGGGRARASWRPCSSRRASPTPIYLAKGEIPLGPFQIARLDNDPSLPDHGQLTLVMEGGK